MWIIDFPPRTSLEEAELYEAPVEVCAEHVRPKRAEARSGTGQGCTGGSTSGPDLRCDGLWSHFSRFIVTPRVSRSTASSLWLDPKCYPIQRLFVFARDDDYFFGVLHSRAHELWALAQGTHAHGSGRGGFRPTRTTTCFQTFPLPWPPGDEPADSPLVEAVAEAARRLNELREGWLNPEGPLVGEDELKRRTLTNLYNQRPAWLDTAHRRLDEAVFNAYGWPPGLSDDEVLARLLALNQERAAAQD